MRLAATRMFPMLLMLALALLTFWLQRAVLDEDQHPALRRHDPDYIVENFTIVNFSAQGLAESTLAGRRMVHFPDDDSTELLAPRLVQTKPDRPRMTLTSDRGALSQDGEDAFLYDNVLLVRDASPEQPEMRMTSSFLHVVRERSLIRSDREVAMREEGRTLTGRGLEYNSDTRQMYLRERVRGTFEPRKN
ncbi:MAG: LPS export ABC transporter periplasmic protein LptC [Betaproteobacteria bacterium]|jgi:lipopolysaccharide export system protein LptC|nr:LPS export ABC transporter periplasmic protein LptC [Betaproteobacteria bacterium]